MSLARAAAAVLAGAVLLAACSSDGGDPPDGAGATSAGVETVEDASALVLGLYEDQAVERAVELVAEDSIPPEIEGDVRSSFENILGREDVQVGATFEHDVDGVRILEVDTSDGIRWCVRPDGHLLLQCRVGIAPVDVDTAGTPVTVHRAEVDVFPEEKQLRIQLRTEEEFTFEGRLTLEEGDGDPAPVIQVQGTLASQGAQVAEVGANTEIVPGTTLLLAWLTDVGASLGEELTLAFGNGTFDVTVQPTEYFVR